MVVPIWIEGSDKVFPNFPKRLFPGLNLREEMVIKIGKPLTFKRFQDSPAIKREQATQKIVSSLLELADEKE